MDATEGEAGDRGSLSIWNSDIGIPIHFLSFFFLNLFHLIFSKLPKTVIWYLFNFNIFSFLFFYL